MSRRYAIVRPLVLAVTLALVAVTAARSATFTVNSTLDTDDAVPGDGVCNDGSGNCTLRAAITEANAFPGADNIFFAIAGAGVKTFQPATDLPQVTAPVLIDGFTQPGAAANTNGFGLGLNTVLRIEIDGSLLFYPTGIVLAGGSSSSTVRGLVINRYGSPIIIFSDDNAIEGCYLGTDPTGVAALPNYLSLLVAGARNRIGGSAPAMRNVISGSYAHGLQVLEGPDNTIEGNLVGTNSAGTAALSNSSAGVEVRGSRNRIIRNLLSGNGTSVGSGLHIGIFGSGDDNVVQGNYIGTDYLGTSAIPNNHAGIDIEGDATGNIIGGVSPGQANVIAFNRDAYNQSGAGIQLAPPPGVPTRNLITGNSIFSNQGLGIDHHDPFGVNPNDPGDGDGGINDGQNYPTLSTAVTGGGSITIFGQLDSAPGASYHLEFFSSPLCDDSGYGEGQTFIGALNVLTDGSGTAPFAPAFAVAVASGSQITATATDIVNNTSEFSACVTATGVTPTNTPTWGKVKLRYR